MGFLVYSIGLFGTGNGVPGNEIMPGVTLKGPVCSPPQRISASDFPIRRNRFLSKLSEAVLHQQERRYQRFAQVKRCFSGRKECSNGCSP